MLFELLLTWNVSSQILVCHYNLSNNVAKYELLMCYIRQWESTSIFGTNDVICCAIWRHLTFLPYQFSIFDDMGGWQRWKGIKWSYSISTPTLCRLNGYFNMDWSLQNARGLKYLTQSPATQFYLKLIISSFFIWCKISLHNDRMGNCQKMFSYKPCSLTQAHPRVYRSPSCWRNLQSLLFWAVLGL